MAKNRNRDAATEETAPVSRFNLSKKKIGKPEMVVVTIQLTAQQDAHLSRVAKEHETTRAELVRQSVFFCLAELGSPFSDTLDEETLAVLEQKREKREARRAARLANAANDSDESVDDTDSEDEDS